MLLSKSEEVKRVPQSITIVSMAKQSNIPKCDVYIDVSQFMVDEFDFHLNGFDSYVQGTLYGHHHEFIKGLASILVKMNLESGVLVIVSCLAGERRSVATVELLAKELFEQYPKVNVVTFHKEFSRWLKF